MPELPEVDAQRAMLAATVVGCQVRRVVCTEQGGGGRQGLFDDKVVAEGVTEAALLAALSDKWVVAACRRGKQLWLELSTARDASPSSSLLIHLGMTGALCVRGKAGPKYKRFSIDAEEWPPRFTKLELVLADGDGGETIELAYTDSRRFGKILLRDQAALSPPISDLAADPILNPPSEAEFGAMLSRSSIAIKAALLDQTRIVCGVGNWVADEVLYQARILPSAPCRELSPEQVKALLAALLHVCKLACSVGADSDQFPDSWLFHHRWVGCESPASLASRTAVHSAPWCPRQCARAQHIAPFLRARASATSLARSRSCSHSGSVSRSRPHPRPLSRSALPLAPTLSHGLLALSLATRRRWANMTTGSITSPLGRIHFDTVGGRTTAFLPHLQKGALGAAAGAPRAPPRGKKAAAAPTAQACSDDATPGTSAPKGKRLRAQPAEESAALPEGEAVAALPRRGKGRATAKAHAAVEDSAPAAADARGGRGSKRVKSVAGTKGATAAQIALPTPTADSTQADPLNATVLRARPALARAAAAPVTIGVSA
jgi:formamidopyrimidine-DNA glycosylase